MVFRYIIASLCLTITLFTQSLDSKELLSLESDKINPQIESKINEFIHKALELELYQKREWQILLHSSNKSDKVTKRAKKSKIPDSTFFFATNGRKSSKDEMIATIKAFYMPIDSIEVPKALQDRVKESKQRFKPESNLPKPSDSASDYHPICRFPARFSFLDSYLHFEDLPQVNCDEYNTMLNFINPKSTTIVFPAAHINSPASMFGHTFILLQSDYKNKLLSYAINYAANADSKQENFFSFAIKGLFGRYNGVYSLLPYYDKLKEYRDTESRDIWEIELNLDEAEVKQLFAHLWELKDLELPYLFFTDNCSYNILWLLEAARPSVNLRKYFIYQVNPPETLFAMQKENLVSAQIYRPSKRTTINAYKDSLSISAVSKAKKLALGKLKPEVITNAKNLDIQDKQFIFESASELTEYNYIHRKLDSASYISIAHNIAAARSMLGASPKPKIYMPQPILNGNQGGRIGAFSLFKNDRFYPGFEFRLSYHDITESDVGYLKGAQIEFLKGSIYLDSSQDSIKKIQINEAKILSIESYGMFNQIFHPISFRLNTGFNRSFLKDSLAYYFSLGGGFSYALNHYMFVYYILEPYFFVQDGARVALGNAIGLNLTSNKRFKLAAEYQNKIYGRINASQIHITLSINLIRNLAVFAQYEHYFYNLTKERFSGIFGLRAYF